MAPYTHWFLALFFIALRYVVIAGAAYYLFYRKFKRRLFYKKIQLKMPKGPDYEREIIYSLLSIFVFALVSSIFLYTPLRSFTLLYTDPARYGYLWYVLAFPVMFLAHDTYFYWIHRLMHQRILFRLIHRVHHLSTNPSPWAAMAFHPGEALLEVGIIPILLLLIPLTPFHLVVFFIAMLVYNVYGHLGWELYPRNFSRHPIGRWINTSVNHNQHHQFFRGNYGLYFLWWDRWMGTIRPDYEKKYEEVKERMIENM
jgi:Delta7-sterol 5-desaturase